MVYAIRKEVEEMEKLMDQVIPKIEALTDKLDTEYKADMTEDDEDTLILMQGKLLCHMFNYRTVINRIKNNHISGKKSEDLISYKMLEVKSEG